MANFLYLFITWELWYNKCMTNQKLVDYVNDKLKQGLNRETISKELVSANWSTKDVEETFTVISNGGVFSLKKKRKIKKIIIFLIIFLILILIKISPYTLIKETCIESNIIAYDQTNGDSLKYVQCLKGNEIKLFPDGGLEFNL